MIRAVLTLIVFFAVSARAELNGLPLWSFHQRPEFKINRFGIYDLEPVELRGPAEIIYLGGEWGLPLRLSTAKRLQFYLAQKLGRPIPVINAEFPHDTIGEYEAVLPALLDAYKPKFVYYRPRAGEIIAQAVAEAVEFSAESWFYRFAKEMLGLNENENQVLLRAAQLQWGSLILGRRLSGDLDGSSALLAPAVASMRRMCNIVEGHGAKFRVIITNQWIYKMSWNLAIPPEIKMLGGAEILKYRQVVSPAGWAAEIKRAGINVLEIPDAEKWILEFHGVNRGRAFDQAARLFAEKISAADFAPNPGTTDF